MNKDYNEIREILVDLTDSLGYDQDYAKHKLAYNLAFNRLCKLIDKIDNAERV